MPTIFIGVIEILVNIVCLLIDEDDFSLVSMPGPNPKEAIHRKSYTQKEHTLNFKFRL